MFEDLFNDLQAGNMGLDAADDLVKTLTVGHSNGTAAPGSLVGGAALQMESCEATLKSVTLSRKNLVLWPSIPQDRAYSMVEQYNRTNSYGDEGSPYIPESGSPAMNDSNYDRHSQKVVLFSTRRGVSLVSNFVRNYGNMSGEASEMNAGTLWILEKVERGLYKECADFSNAGEFDGSQAGIPKKIQNLFLFGLEQQIRVGDQDATAQIRAFDGYGGNQTVIKDVRDVLDETVIEDLANTLGENTGFPTVLDLSPKTLSDFVKQFYPKERVTALGTLDGRAGYVVRTMATSMGDIGLRPNLFIRPKLGPKAQQDRASVPGAPSDLQNNAAQSVIIGGGNLDQYGATSNLSQNDQYFYTVASCNEQGEGNQTQTSTTVTVSADGNNVTFKIIDPGSGAVPTHYAVYRSSSDGLNSVAGKGVPAFIGYVKRDPSGATLFTDAGRRIEGSAQAYMLDMRPESIVWKQLAPLMKVPQGQVGTAREFLMLLAATLILFSPRWCGVMQNIVRAA